jgi:Na+/H+ antiporter NhaD/arsenite permease-like protein
VRGPRGLLAATVLLSGGLSALLVNDVVCLALTPLVLHLARQRGFDPRPHLIGLAVASNIGSAATLTGNPQNMMIGNFSQIGYARFAARLAPVALLGLAVAYVMIARTYRSALRPVRAVPEAPAGEPARNGTARRPLHRAKKLLLVKALVITGGAVVLFFAGAPMAVVALGAASLLLLGRTNPRKVYERVDWGLLVMFAGLFVVVRAFEVHVLAGTGVERSGALRDDPVGLLSLASAALSNVVSNVPAVLLFKPVVLALPAATQETAWLALAM